MKKNIINPILAASITLAMASCGENTWNDKYLDGFEGGVNYDNPSATEGKYTLTADDYAAISKLMLAQATTDAETAEAKAIATNMYFDKNGVYTAQVAVPAFMNTAAFPYYLDANGSSVAMTYAEAAETPAELTALAGAMAYTVNTVDYQRVWESEENYTEAFAPSHTAAKSLPAVLKAAYPDATAGQYVVATYNTSATDPVFNAAEEPSFEPTQVLGSLTKGTSIDVKGYVAAISSQGPIVTDGAGSVFVYAPVDNNNLKIGDQVSFTGNVDSYNYGFQIAKGAELNVVGTQEVKNPTPRTWTGSEIDAFVAASMAADATPITPVYSTFNGTVTISGNYINIVLDGTAVQLSPYGATDAVKAMFTDGASVTVEGYVIALASKGKFFNTVVTKVNGNAVKAPAHSAPARVAAVASTVENAVYTYTGSAWTAAEGVSVLNPADYTAMGFANNKLEDAAIYIPAYLKKALPYAQSGDQRFVVYNGAKVNLFVYDGADWTLNDNGLETVTARYTRKNNAWSFVKYLGKAVFNLFDQAQIELDRNYLFVCGDQCATPLDKSKNYGYPVAVTVPVNNGVIVLSTDAYAFTFASSYADDEAGTVTKAPEGTFLLVDSNGRYMYMSGSYNSPNLSAAPAINNGTIDETYLWTASNNGDGTWTIMRGDRTWMLSTNYGSFGGYQVKSDLEVMPSLYILD